MSDGIEVSMSIGPPKDGPPHIGPWQCSCGAIKWGPPKSLVPTSLWVQCPSCGDEAEIMGEIG